MERIKAARGSALRCKGWRQEALLRMLEHVLENGENQQELVVYVRCIGKSGARLEVISCPRRQFETPQR